MPDRSDRYQLPSWPATSITRDLWNSVLGDIADRITAREDLEATFEALQATGIQASLDYIQATVAPQIATLQVSIDLAQQQLDQIIIDGISPNSLKLGGELPEFYATATALTDGLATKVPTTLTVAGKALNADVTLVKADVGLGNVDNTADADKPVSAPQSAALAGKASLSGAAFTGGIQVPHIEFPTPNFRIDDNIGTGHPGVAFDNNDYIDFDRTNDVMRSVVGGNVGWLVDSLGRLDLRGVPSAHLGSSGSSFTLVAGNTYGIGGIHSQKGGFYLGSAVNGLNGVHVPLSGRYLFSFRVYRSPTLGAGTRVSLMVNGGTQVGFTHFSNEPDDSLSSDTFISTLTAGDWLGMRADFATTGVFLQPSHTELHALYLGA